MDYWLRLAERIIGDWASTLWVALALAIGLAALLVAMGLLICVVLGVA